MTSWKAHRYISGGEGIIEAEEGEELVKLVVGSGEYHCRVRRWVKETEGQFLKRRLRDLLNRRDYGYVVGGILHGEKDRPGDRIKQGNWKKHRSASG